VLASTAAEAVPALPLLAQVFGWSAGTVGIAIGWPQAWRLWVGRRHAGLSLSSNSSTILYSLAWLLYGVASHRLVQIVTCAIGFGVASAVLAGHVWLSRPRTRSWLPLVVVGALVVLGLFVAGRGPLGIAASAATISGVLPQMLSQLRDRRRGVHSVGGVSVARWVLAAACNVLWVGYGVLAHDPLIVVNSTIIAALSATIVVLTVSSSRIEALTAECEDLTPVSLSLQPR
jgi:uncharacterized protein with PQ loop repeat